MNPYKMVIAVANQKGGCAKTTTAVNLAAALAKGSRKQGVPPAKVLLVDLDVLDQRLVLLFQPQRPFVPVPRSCPGLEQRDLLDELLSLR